MRISEVFISYNAAEIETVFWFRKKIEEAGISCWMAVDGIQGGASYAAEITDAVKNCKAFVLLLSKLAQKSIWIEKELNLAIKENIPILYVLIEDCEINENFKKYLAKGKTYNAFSDKEQDIQRVIGDIKKIINGEQIDLSVDGEITSKANEKNNKLKIGIISSVVGALLIGIGIYAIRPTDSDTDQAIEQSTAYATLDESVYELSKKANWEIGESFAMVVVNDYGSKELTIICQVKNTGDINLVEQSAIFEVENSKGELLTTVDYGILVPDVLRPGETGYCLAEQSLRDDYPSDLKVISNLEMRHYPYEEIRLDTSDVKIHSTENGNLRITGKIINNTEREEINLDIAAFLFDSNDQLITVYNWNLGPTAIESGAKQEFSKEISSERVNGKDVDHCVVYVYQEQMSRVSDEITLDTKD